MFCSLFLCLPVQWHRIQYRDFSMDKTSEYFVLRTFKGGQLKKNLVCAMFGKHCHCNATVYLAGRMCIVQCNV